ncbi:MAG: protein translocase subunit [Thelocarpon impressellum]|nr:MAG: protein translocase subunit [Thelocarpon impressellum]
MDTLNNFGSSGSGTSSASTKNAVMDQVRQESAINNARQVIEKLNEHCFEKCIPTPGTSLSRGEETCYSNCMKKYMEMWGAVNKQYVTRLTQEQRKGGGGFGGGF